MNGAGLEEYDGGQRNDAPAGQGADRPTTTAPDNATTAIDAENPTTASDPDGSTIAVDAGNPSTATDRLDAPGRPDLDDPLTLRAAIEAVLFVVEAPITPAALASALQRPEAEVQAAVADLAAELRVRGSGIELREIAGGVRLYTRSDLGAWIEAFLLDGQRARLTQAALETLAVIAYRQPVTRARISAIRGVNVDGVVRTLTTRGLITEVGADPDTGGGLYRTTELFLEKMGLNSLDELPSLAPLLPELDGAESDEL